MAEQTTRTIWKFQIPIQDRFEVSMPYGATVLTVEMRNGKPCVWALVDVFQPKAWKRFRLAGTGHPITEQNLRHVGTFQMDDGALVFHLFEIEGGE